MGNEKTEPQGTDSTSAPISKVESRMMPARPKQSVVEARMAQARRTFAALAVAANDPPTQLRAEFKLTGIGSLRTTTVGNFLLVDHNSESGSGFVLSFEYRGREQLKHVSNSERVDGALRKMLMEHGLTFKGASSATANRLTIDPVVPAAVTVAAERVRERVTVTLRNVVNLGATSYTFTAERFDHKLIEALVELISTQSHDFYAIASASH